jgi:hypothetical protein
VVDRRTVLKLGATSAASVLINVSATALGAIGPGSSRHPLARAIFDGRSAEGLAFASEMRGRGVATSEIGTDLAKLWYGDLQVHLRRSAAPIAGLTDRATLFCLEELARSVGMKVRYRVDHKADSIGHVQHDAVGPTSIIKAASKLDSRSGYGHTSGYGRTMAVLASQFDPRESRETDAQKRTGPFSPENAPVFVSWVIA